MSDCGKSGNEQLGAKGVVTSLRGDWVEVTIHRQGCGRCDEPGGCGGQLFTQLLGGQRSYWVKNSISATVGDPISLFVAPDQVSWAAFVAYLRPLSLSLLGALIGKWIYPTGEAGPIAGVVLGLLLGFLWLRRAARVSSDAHPAGGQSFSIKFDR